jgi:hypothetical protein
MDFHDTPPNASKNPSISSLDLLQPLITPPLSLQYHTGIQLRQEYICNNTWQDSIAPNQLPNYKKNKQSRKILPLFNINK